ncbi:permease prefix domain 1-containing protein [Nonomuraea sp. NPDC050022]|uniref:permease prefix domain 1-containing protein n=1 Tax=Nonomuraea sp. NPDC050022 TaxID=3364358 RepID=UPI003796C09A
MAGHPLITAELDALAQRLPPQAVEELADGLAEAYEHQLHEHGDPEAAARAAIAEFGDADTISAAFCGQAPWRRTALTLLATGPVMAAVWAATLAIGQAWTWPLPAAAKAVYGMTLVVVVGLLAVVIRERRAYRRGRVRAVGAAVGLLILDGLMLATLALLVPVPVWPMALAVPASLIRILLTVRTLPTMLSSG